MDGSPLIIYRRSLPTPDQRMAIAHAIAHLLFDLEECSAGCRPGSAGDPARERRADAFAIELLLPLEELRPYARDPVRPTDAADEAVWLDMVDEIASHFKVPAWVVERQLLELVD